VYAAGSQSGTNDYTYGDGVAAAGACSNKNVALVKYDSAGKAKWAKTLSAGSSYSSFHSVAVDGSGNVYAGGYQRGMGDYTYGDGVTAKGIVASDNVALVKYDSAGTAQWAKTLSAGSGISQFHSVAVDGSGNVYAAGYQNGPGAYTYGDGVTATGTSTRDNVALVKYDSAGAAKWAKTVSAEGPAASFFYSAVVDGSGNVYAAGYQSGKDTYDYGDGVTAAGTSTGGNVVIVKY
jgi:hypothetical protein